MIATNPNGTERRHAGKNAFILDGVTVRKYTRDKDTNVASLKKEETFPSENAARKAFLKWN